MTTTLIIIMCALCILIVLITIKGYMCMKRSSTKNPSDAAAVTNSIKGKIYHDLKKVERKSTKNLK